MASFNDTPETIAYDYSTGFKDVLMDVEISASEDSGAESEAGSGGGCSSLRSEELRIRNVLMSLMMLLALGLAALRREK